MKTNDFFLIAGPCVVESAKTCMIIAETLCKLTEQYEVPFVFKASYRKENRTRYDSFTGIGDLEGLKILQSVKQRFHIPVTTDIHTPEEAPVAAAYGWISFKYRFLCRQTTLLRAAAKTGQKSM